MDDRLRLILGLGGGILVLLVLLLVGYLLLANPDAEQVVTREETRSDEAAPEGPVETPKPGEPISQEMRDKYPELNLLLPPSDDEGIPFQLTDASAHANEANKLMRMKRFQEALEEYRQASKLDPRYETALQRCQELVRNIDKYGLERVKNWRVFPGDKLTYKQLYGWQ